MTTILSQWGNSLGLRLPKKLTDQLNLSHGSEIEILSTDGGIVLRPLVRDLSLDELVEDMESSKILDQYDQVRPEGKEKFWEEK